MTLISTKYIDPVDDLDKAVHKLPSFASSFKWITITQTFFFSKLVVRKKIAWSVLGFEER